MRFYFLIIWKIRRSQGQLCELQYILRLEFQILFAMQEVKNCEINAKASRKAEGMAESEVPKQE